MAYITESGFQKKSLQEIRQEIEDGLKQSFGPSFETSVDSPNGLFISQWALTLSKLWELAQVVFNSRDPNQATGVALDWAASLSRITRRPASACKVNALLYTDERSVTIPSGSMAMRSRGNLKFTLDESVDISASSCKSILISDDGSELDTDYTFKFSFGDVTINNDGTEYESNIDYLKSRITASGIKCDKVGESLRVYSESGSNIGIAEPLPSDFTILYGCEGGFTAVTTGVQTCDIGELDAIPTAVDGWVLVYNYVAGVSGGAAESDNELRLRRAASASVIQGKGTDASVESHLMQDVDGVTSAKVVSNRGLNTDSNGVPGKSMHVLVVGGADEAVAQCIYDNQASGIQSYGSTTVMITDDNGDEQAISFSRPTAKYLWVKISWTPYTEETKPTNNEIKAAILEWAETEYQLGKDVIPDRVKVPLYKSLTGIGPASVEVALTNAPTDEPQYVSSVISVLPLNYAVLSFDRITLNEV